MAKTKNLLFVILAALIMTGSVVITGCTSSDISGYTYNLAYEKSGTIFVPAVQQDFKYKIKLEHNVVTLNFMGLDFSFPLYNAGESRLKTDGYNQYIEVQIGNDIVPIPIRECVGCGTNTDGTKGVRIIEEKLIMIEPK